MMKKTMLLGATVLISASAFANQNTDTRGELIPRYGDNPNLFHVFAYKAQEGVLNTADKVGEVTEKGISKVKPAVDRVWNKTQSTASTTVEKVDQGVTGVAQQANQGIQTTKERIAGSNEQAAPIVQQSLSTAPTTQQTAPPSSSGSATSYAITDL